MLALADEEIVVSPQALGQMAKWLELLNDEREAVRVTAAAAIRMAAVRRRVHPVVADLLLLAAHDPDELLLD